MGRVNTRDDRALRKPIELENLDGLVKTYTNVRRAIRVDIGENVLCRIDSFQSMAARALECFESHGTPLLTSRGPNAIGASCWRVMMAMETPEAFVPLSDDATIRLFVRHVVGLHMLPAGALAAEYDRIHADLRVLGRIVERYMNEEGVAEIVDGQRAARDHRTRRSAVFHARCVREQQNLIRSLETARSHAISVSDEDTRQAMTLLGGWSPWWRSGLPVSHGMRLPHYDWRQNDRCRHRLLNLPVKQGWILVDLYAKGRLRAFYERLEQYRGVKKVFGDMLQELRSRESLRRLSPTVTELRRLFYARSWRGFYALAMPQIEGLLGEMSRSLGRRVSNSLTDKVLRLWDRYSFADSSFDYFAWHLPDQRNRFCHTGVIDGDPRWAAHDILYDLDYVVRVYREINSPLIRLEGLLGRGGESGLIRSREWFLEVLECLDDLGALSVRDRPARFFEFERELKADPSVVDDIVQASRTEFHAQVVTFAGAFNDLAADIKPGFDVTAKATHDIREIAGPIRDAYETNARSAASRAVLDYARLARGLSRHFKIRLDTVDSKYRELLNNLKALKLVPSGGTH